jgi:predicted PurR-regulated permease PerM
VSDHSPDPPREGPTEIRVQRRGTVPPSAVVPPAGDFHTTLTLRPEHLYKGAALLFLFAVLFHYLELVVRVLLITYAAAIVAVLLNAIIQILPGKRRWMTGLLGLLILGGVAAVLWFGIPILVGQIQDLTSRVPELTALLTSAERWIQANTGLNVQLVGPEADAFFQRVFRSTAGGGSEILSRAQGLLGALLIPLLIFFGGLYAVGSPNDGLISPLLRAVPRDRRLAFRRVVQLLGDRILGWLKGVLIGMVAVGVLSFIGYWLAGVPNALALAVFAGLTEAIPLVGPWIGGGVAVAVAFLDDPTTGLYAAIVALVVQQLENNLIIPWAMAQAAEIHPFVTLFALVLFGSLFGFLGVLLSIPIMLLIATLVQVLWVERAIDTDEDPIAPVVEG